MKTNDHKIKLSDKQVEFLVKCIDTSQSIQSMKPDFNESEIIRTLSDLNEKIQEIKLGKTIYYDLS